MLIGVMEIQEAAIKDRALLKQTTDKKVINGDVL